MGRKRDQEKMSSWYIGPFGAIPEGHVDATQVVIFHRTVVLVKGHVPGHTVGSKHDKTDRGFCEFGSDVGAVVRYVPPLHPVVASARIEAGVQIKFSRCRESWKDAG